MTITANNQKTIADFGSQWKKYTKNESYYGSKDCLTDIFGPLLSGEFIRGKNIIDIGSGTGRIVNMLLDLGASHVTAVEPSEAMDVLLENVAERASKVTAIRATGDKIPEEVQADLVLSIGVLHHIDKPAPVVQSAYRALKPGGRILIWLYAREGNELYLSVFGPLRKMTTLMSDEALLFVCRSLNRLLDLYLALCKFIKLPMRDYMLGHIAKLSRNQREMTIFDQLNPAYAKYYREKEAKALLADNGFKNVQLFHRHGYSWTVYGEKR